MNWLEAENPRQVGLVIVGLSLYMRLVYNNLAMAE